VAGGPVVYINDNIVTFRTTTITTTTTNTGAGARMRRRL